MHPVRYSEKRDRIYVPFITVHCNNCSTLYSVIVVNPLPRLIYTLNFITGTYIHRKKQNIAFGTVCGFRCLWGVLECISPSQVGSDVLNLCRDTSQLHFPSMCARKAGRLSPSLPGAPRASTRGSDGARCLGTGHRNSTPEAEHQPPRTASGHHGASAAASGSHPVTHQSMLHVFNVSLKPRQI